MKLKRDNLTYLFNDSLRDILTSLEHFLKGDVQ